ncbi:hypothetical protein HU200_043108 [Digitaria exilis]|uniref:Uncharacterized protein n=1 Tax=Digitaria exilis TaxID=1010633 RepID=A0A835B6P1_9POAL|nr:hypothetical protein HU200_043108 [Digitaria exilis]
MQLLQFVAACLFPGAMTAAATKLTKASTTSDPDNASSSMAFSVEAPDSASSISSSTSSSSSDDGDHHPTFFASRPQSPSASSPLCFGAGGAARWLLRRSHGGARAPSPPKQAASKGDDVVGWYLRKIARRLRKAARTPGGGKGISPATPGRAGDDTARERAESVARAVAYCKDTLRRGDDAPPPPTPMRSLDDWLHDRQEEIIASVDDAFGNGSTNSQTTPPPPPPRPHRPCGISEMPAMEKKATHSASTRQESSNSITDDVAHGHDAIGAECRGESSVMAAEAAMSSSSSDPLETDELEMRAGSFDEMEFLKMLDGDKEMIGRHFISIHI